jgi:hypothetical protein
VFASRALEERRARVGRVHVFLQLRFGKHGEGRLRWGMVYA